MTVTASSSRRTQFNCRKVYWYCHLKFLGYPRNSYGIGKYGVSGKPTLL